jgi:tripartite-type tricarboxylate transporter receptor subunit TctC
MNRPVHRRTAIATLATGAALVQHVLCAQTFPSRPIRIIVPVSPGGGVDVFARLMAAKVQTQGDVQFVVGNRTGGNSTIGGFDVQRAAPDGLAVTSRKRSTLAPDIPTTAEVGLPQLAFGAWWAMWG